MSAWPETAQLKAQATTGDAARSLLQHADFRWFWGSSAITSFGGQVSMLAIPLTAVTLLDATPSQMGLLVGLETAPYALFSLHAGVWIDRARKMPILQVSELLAGLTLALVPVLAWWNALSMPVMYAVAFMLGINFTVAGTASQVMLTQLVGRERLVDALSRFTSTESAAKLTGPGVAGALIHWIGAPFAIALDATTFLISFFMLRRVQYHEDAPESGSDARVWREIAEGWRVVRHNPVLWSLAVSGAVWQLVFQGFQALIMIFAARELHMSPGLIGAAHMIGGVGALAASLAGPRLTKHLGIGPPILMGLMLSAVAWSLLPFVPAPVDADDMLPFAALSSALLVLDFGVTIYIIHYLSLRSAITPDALLGRMTATMRFMTVALAPLGAITAGKLGEAFGLRAAMAACATLAVVLCAMVAWRSSAVRVRVTLPDRI
jgi:predicted MFS family arabinose efflux permease